MSVIQDTQAQIDNGAEIVTPALVANFNLGTVPAPVDATKEEYHFDVTVAGTDITFDATTGALNAAYKSGNTLSFTATLGGVGKFLVTTAQGTYTFGSDNDVATVTVIDANTVRVS